jgi:hypothetical protein
MSKARLIGIYLLALLCFECICARAQAAENCHTPTPQFLIKWFGSAYGDAHLRYSAKNSLIYHPIEVFQTKSPRINWIGLAWLAPEWGALFAADCTGKPLAAVSVGAVGKIKAGPVIPSLGQTVMFIYVDKETADCVHDSADIVALKDGKVVSLWNHAYRQGMNVGASKTRRGAFVTHNYAVTFSGDGRSVRVSGLVQKYAYRANGSQSPTPTSTVTLPSETYRWDAGGLRFLPRQNYAQIPACAAGGLQRAQ